jgi:hypothetical protein
LTTTTNLETSALESRLSLAKIRKYSKINALPTINFDMAIAVPQIQVVAQVLQYAKLNNA